jgi:hypothetical protein
MQLNVITGGLQRIDANARSEDGKPCSKRVAAFGELGARPE